MTNAWDDMRKAKEEAYFQKRNEEAMARLAKKTQGEKPRISPVSGKPMEQVIVDGVVIDRCPESGGVWLDAGELEQLIEAAKSRSESASEGENWVSSMFKSFSGKK